MTEAAEAKKDGRHERRKDTAGVKWDCERMRGGGMPMCGRYYLNGETVREIGELLALWNRRAGGKDCSNTGGETSGWEKERGLWKKRGREILKAAAETGRKAQMEAGEEFCPGRTAPVLVWNGEEFAVEEKRWGFSGREKNRLLFNARAETAMKKPSFRGCMEARRCLALASCFYEWNQAGERFTFTGPAGESLLLAGCYQAGEERDEFAILTVGADQTMLPVHERMPLIIEKSRAWEWLKDGRKTAGFLEGPFPEIEKKTEYEQLSFSFLQ